MKTLLMVGLKKSYAFKIPDHEFEKVKFALSMFISLWRRPSQERQIEFLVGLGYKKRPYKFENNSRIMFKSMGED